MRKVAIRSITQFKQRPQVFNFETEKNHTYIANGVVVHNCDSWYTWMFETPKGSSLPIAKHNFAKPVKRETSVIEVDPVEVAQKIDELCGPHFKRVVFTGGEPLLQQKMISEIVAILKKMDPSYQVETETNGTVKILEGNEYMDQINCSPKLESSGNSKKDRDKPEVIEQFINLWKKGKRLSFKFVVSPEKISQDLDEIEEWVAEHNVPRELVYLMPEGVTGARIAEGTDLLMPVCRERGFKLTTRLHVLLYGSKLYV